MFSVIIPLYNKTNYIVKSINSVFSQTYTDFELIIVDDGSTDNGPEKVKQFSDPRIRLISQANGGASNARNNGVAAAKHDYIAFLDADDWWDDHFLEEMKSLIEKYPDAGIYGSNFYLVKNGISHPSTVGLPENFKEGYIDYCSVYASTFCVPVNCSFVVVPKKIFNSENGFKPQLKYGEDFDLWIRIVLKYKVGYINKALAYSNQDVEKSGRALGVDKLYSKDSYYLFNLGYLEPYETQNGQLKILMDGLRVRALLRYYLNKTYMKEVKEQLAKVDFNLQPRYFRLIYTLPLFIVKSYFSFLRLGSAIKSKVLH